MQMRSELAVSDLHPGGEWLKGRERHKRAPTQKAEALWCVSSCRSTEPGPVVLDPFFFGSGTTGPPSPSGSAAISFASSPATRPYIDARPQSVYARGQANARRPRRWCPCRARGRNAHKVRVPFATNRSMMGLVQAGRLRFFDARPAVFLRHGVRARMATVSVEDARPALHRMGARCSGPMPAMAGTIGTNATRGGAGPIYGFAHRPRVSLARVGA